LKVEWARVRDPLLDHPVVRFFLERNPRYHEGQELVCLTEFAADNLRSCARLAFLEGLSAEVELAGVR
jgi:hypothetical protein